MYGKNKIPIIPGRGLNSDAAIKLRLEYLQMLNYKLENIQSHHFETSELVNNIESFIGSTELPLGIVGPLINKADNELLYCAAGTLEGALIASMNRGARAVSNSGGFSAEIIHQRMTRSPLFIFEKMADAVLFKKWTTEKFQSIKSIAENYSNHAVLESIQAFLIGKSVHLKFAYTTGDASGQNMTTTCTWHAVLWMVENFQNEKNIHIVHFVIEGNGSSDKKVSHSSFTDGRGIHVAAECFLEENQIKKVLRTTSDEILACFAPSLAMSKIDGMIGYNINVANAIAAIFVATGQDLGSLHESSTGILSIEKLENGLYMALNLPTLVVGTVGGGTHLPRQKEALEIMGCWGKGKVERFAKMIAGFSLALEISTYSAIVGGEFAKAHEKLGRNKPVNWLRKSDITREFIREALLDKSLNILEVKFLESSVIDNGILTDITRRVNRKLIGFIPLQLGFGNNQQKQVLIKSKALDIEVIKGLHLMAASIDPELSDLIYAHKKQLEYDKCHEKEISLYENLSKEGFDCIPEYLGKYINMENETWLFMQEFLYYGDMALYNTENTPEKWKESQIKRVISSITSIHQRYETHGMQKTISGVKNFKAWESADLYKKLVSIMYREAEDEENRQEFNEMLAFVDELEVEYRHLTIPTTIIHNDFNSRNIAVRKNGTPCIYDWELAVVNIPHRDIVEFLSFVLTTSFSREELMNYLHYHYQLYKEASLEWHSWVKGYVYAIKEYLVTRVSFYEVSGIVTKFDFSERIRKTSFRMLGMLLEEE